MDKEKRVKDIFEENGIIINDKDEILDLDSLSFLTLIIDLESKLSFDLNDVDILFEIDRSSYTFNKIFECIEKYI